jgi:hypothetical protein
MQINSTLDEKRAFLRIIRPKGKGLVVIMVKQCDN